MPIYSYHCKNCGEFDVCKPMKDSERDEKCPSCGSEGVRMFDFNVAGTRDSFGIRNAFQDKTTGQTIDTWSKWEKAGYRDLKETVQGSKDRQGQKNFILERVKEKEDKILHKEGKKFNVGVR